MAPDSIIRQLTSQLIEPTDHVSLLYIKTTLTRNSFLKNGEDESRDEEEGANLTFMRICHNLNSNAAVQDRCATRLNGDSKY